MKKQKTFLLTDKALKNLEKLKILYGISLNEVVEKSINNLAEISKDKQKFEILTNNFDKNSTQITYQYQQIAIQLLEFQEEISTIKTELDSYKEDKKTTLKLLFESKNEFENWKKKANGTNLLLEKLRTDLAKLPFKSDEEKNNMLKILGGLKDKIGL